MSTRGEPIPWSVLARFARGRAVHLEATGRAAHARAEERFAAYCERRERAAGLAPGEPPIRGLTCSDDTTEEP